MEPMRRGFLAAAAFAGAIAIWAGSGHGEAGLGGWLVYGNGAARTGFSASDVGRPPLHRLWSRRLRGRITSQLLVADDPSAGRLVLAATTSGDVYALTAGGSIRWHARLGRQRHSCRQLRGYGVQGTPGIDSDTRTLYVAGAYGLLHALDHATGAERPGWPVRLYADYRRELVWGALAIADGAVYVPTGSFCDRPMEGKVLRVDLATRAVTSWTAVPRRLGGGGGIWGWGGVAHGDGRDSLLVVTGNAFAGGVNRGHRFSGSAGFGERLVELSPELTVRAASHPGGITSTGDYDFVGSPVVFDRPGCGELVAATNKNGLLYVWRSDRIAAGPVAVRRIARTPVTNPVLAQLAYSPLAGSLYAVTHTRVLRIDVGAACRIRIRWARPLGAGLPNGSPSIAGHTLWFVRTNGEYTLLGVDTATGRVRYRARVGSFVLTAPAVDGNAVYVGGFSGRVTAFAAR